MEQVAVSISATLSAAVGTYCVLAAAVAGSCLVAAIGVLVRDVALDLYGRVSYALSHQG
jgi:hypothetical protein